MSNKEKITMQTIANEVGVSITTVSHVINRTRPVDITLREKVLEAAQRLGYNKDRSNAQKRKSLTSHIGLIIPGIRDKGLFRDIIEVTETVANENGYTLLLGDSYQSPEKEINLIEMFLKKQVNGLILASVLESAAPLQELPFFNTVPTVLIDRKWEQQQFDFVGVDNFTASFDATSQLIKKGLKNIQFLFFENITCTLKDRERGYKLAMQDSGLSDNIASHCLNVTDDIVQQIQDILSSDKKPDAFYCHSSFTFYEVIVALKALKIKIPDDIYIMCFDNSRWFKFFEFPFSVIRQPSNEIGQNAANLLIQKIESSTTPNESIGRQILLPTEYVEYTKD